MTRNRRLDVEVLRREYVFDSATPPVSLTDLAEKYGHARSGLAAYATQTKPTWFEQREEFRKQLGEKVIASMADDWMVVHKARFEKMVQAMTFTLDKYIERLENGEIKPGTRDAVSVVAALRVLTQDERAQITGEKELIDPQAINLPPEKLIEMIPTLKRLLGGRMEEAAEGDFRDASDSEPGPVDGYAPTGTEGTG